MPADHKPGNFNGCASEAALSDAEIARIVRDAADELDITGEFAYFALIDFCKLENGHDGLHGRWAAAQAAGVAWLRWNDAGSYVEWLTGCPKAGCLLFRGHPGACHCHSTSGPESGGPS